MSPAGRGDPVRFGSAPAAPARSGLLLAIAASEDRSRERLLLASFVQAAGGQDASLLVLALADGLTLSEGPTTERCIDLLCDLHAETVDALRLGAEAEGGTALDQLEYATGLLLPGGDPLRLSAALSGTPLGEAIRRRYAAGMAVAGLGAGGAALGEQLVVLREGAGTPRRRPLHLAPALGLVPGVIFDPHFRQRDRLGRLMAALASAGVPLAVSLDADTAVAIDPEGGMWVLGSGAAMVVETAPGPPAAAPPPGPMPGLHLDVLTDGCRYDLRRRSAAAAVPSGALDRAAALPPPAEE